MNWFSTFLTSSIGRKVVMAVTGLFLISFLIVHCTINAMIFFNDGGESFNKAAHFMGTNVIIRTMEIVLFLGIILHIVQGFMLSAKNRAARPTGYAVTNPGANSKWYSRSMTLLGTLILLFLVMHISHFWTHSRLGGIGGISPLDETMIGDKEVLNLYALMISTFQSPVVLIVYILGVISLCWHLVHGFQSAFQTLGVNHKKYTPVIKGIGIVFSILICALFAAMPLSIYMGWIA
ncbi:MAG TPA: succinate dehydrogenase cytochrome b subunit [Chitinophagales bacterium]|nr:succinate dehydrogenase cytochrome b subunit [Chitinophagales bacterium]HMZ88399.1 succinate dehydrogenase cytochrome b subunit [Chitinophagales bacterium]HNI55091.1 succinate dehydrogenase cytochrome b subunit [Chitinophagales bacterium]HNJ89907.1 succinate dehydrogenase cytochrome b subunit [Chitinophagales bacterium]